MTDKHDKFINEQNYEGYEDWYYDGGREEFCDPCQDSPYDNYTDDDWHQEALGQMLCSGSFIDRLKGYIANRKYYKLKNSLTDLKYILYWYHIKCYFIRKFK